MVPVPFRLSRAPFGDHLHRRRDRKLVGEMNKILYGAYQKAKSEGRICLRCGWIVTIKDWKKGNRLCAGCTDALQGVNVDYGHNQPPQEPIDQTGNNL